jgi:L-fucose isomerase-like protein
MKMELSFFASPLARREAVEASEAWIRREIEDAQGLEAGPGAGEPAMAAGSRVRVAVVLTGGTEAEVLERFGPGIEPALLLALPHSNSLPAALEVLARLRQLGRTGRIIVAGRGSWLKELASAVTLVALVAYLRRARLGLLGGPSSWLAASSPDPALVSQAWGPEVHTISLAEVVERYRSADRISGRVGLLLTGAVGVVEPDEATLYGADRLYRILRDIVVTHGLDALAVRCFDLLGDIGNTGCLGLSRLNDEGRVAACEGDLPAALTMMVLGGISGRACLVANPSDLNMEAGTVTFAHCSVPLSLVSSFRLRSHFESGLGVGLEGHFSPGPVTVARIGGEDLREIAVACGEILPESEAPFREDLCRTQVTVKLGEEATRDLIERPLGNHHVLTLGDHVRAFRDVVSLLPARSR